MQKGVAVAAGRLPKISARVHSAMDYAIAGSFMLAGALFWKRNRRAALGSLLCGGATAVVSLLTDYSGDSRKPISYPMHGKIEAGLIAMTASVPRLVGVEDDKEARFFSRQALARTAITAMSDFDPQDNRKSRHDDDHLGI
jgi:hypothetical protein